MNQIAAKQLECANLIIRELRRGLHGPRVHDLTDGVVPRRESAAHRSLDEFRDHILAGAPLTTRWQVRGLSALGTIRENYGAAAARAERARLDDALHRRIGQLRMRRMDVTPPAVRDVAGSIAGTRGASPSGPRGVPAAQLRLVHTGWLEAFRDRKLA